MPTLVRKIIRIDEEKCDGCGLCVPSCAEGALQIVDGKARMISEKYCDGLGACLGECPQGAISFEEREAEDYDQEAVVENLKKQGRDYVPHSHDEDGHHQHGHAAHPAPHAAHGHGGCPSARTLTFNREEQEEDTESTGPKQRSELGQWPVKLNLVNPNAPYFQDADLLLAADCVPFAYASLHPDYLKGKAVAIGCPKFDDLAFYREKLTAILQCNRIKSITVIHMEVPCCTGLLYIAQDAVEASGKSIPVKPVKVTLRGEVVEPAVP